MVCTAGNFELSYVGVTSTGVSTCRYQVNRVVGILVKPKYRDPKSRDGHTGTQSQEMLNSEGVCFYYMFYRRYILYII